MKTWLCLYMKVHLIHNNNKGHLYFFKYFISIKNLNWTVILLDGKLLSFIVIVLPLNYNVR